MYINLKLHNIHTQNIQLVCMLLLILDLLTQTLIKIASVTFNKVYMALKWSIIELV